MHCGKRGLCYLAQTLCLLGGGESNLGVNENSYFFGGQKENVSNKENSLSPIRDFINERSLKLTKILNLNLLKFDCQNLPFRYSLVSSDQN